MLSCLEQYADNTAAINDKGESISYSELAAQADDLANKIGGVKKLIFISSANNFQTLVAYFACLRHGHAALMLDCMLNQELIDSLINLYQPNFFWGPKNNDIYKLTELVKGKHSTLHHDTQLLLSTSGSTGSPKLVRLTKENLNSNAQAIASYLDISKDERPITSLPPHYSYGLSVINSHLLKGATLLLTNHTIMQREFWTFFKEQRATSLSGVPYIYEMLKRLRFSRMELPSLRTMTQAGGKLSQELVEEFSQYTRENNIQFYVMYGQTEASARIAFLPPEHLTQFPNSIGHVIPGGKWWLEDEHGKKINKNNTVGELIYSGPNVMQGYASNIDELANADELNGVLRTGDLAHFDEHLLCYIVGRLKRFIKIFGNRIGLAEIEQYISSMGFSVACSGEDNLLKVFVMSVSDETLISLKEKIISRYKFHHSVVQLYSIKEFPINSSGKLLYSKLDEKIKV